MLRIVIVSLLLITGCARHYSVPASSPKATVIFSSDIDGVMVQSFADKTCGESPNGTRVAYFFRDHFDQRAGTAKEVIADREFVFTFRSRSDTGTVATFCSVTRAFIPEASQTYRAHFIYLKEGCGIELTRASTENPVPNSEEFVDAEAIVPACLDDFNG
jgi:hypothetical protein